MHESPEDGREEPDRFDDLPGAFAPGPSHDPGPVDDSGTHPPPVPSRVASWSRSTFAGAVMTGFALGLREVLEAPRDDQIVIEVDADGEPHDLPIRLMLDPDSPEGSLCIVRRDPPPPVI
ncbi:MAG: hypothetical protein R2701_04555 [Acidimicrobiales bacterium]|nr:hypothetical protein [Acidimicrobiales bacterium]